MSTAPEMIPFLELALMDNHRDLMICMAESDVSVGN